jgi:DNA-binding transcriptional regulator YhcF (GntR family)
MPRDNKRSSTKRLPSLVKLRLSRHSRSSSKGSVLNLLRRVARRNRQTQAIRFYSIRSVATRFHVSPTVVSRYYQQLQAEGLLTTVWGAKTIIAPLPAPTRKKAYVIPISVTELMVSESYRNYVLSLHRRLRSRGIAEHLIFFESIEGKASIGNRL